MAQLSLADIITRSVTDLKEKFASLVNGVVSVAQGGTGKGSHTSNSVLVGDGTNAVKNVASASGALYATAANGAPQFGTLPVEQGGTGATTAALARANLEVVKDSAIAYVESTTATTNHAIGDYFMLGNVLMNATAAIAAGETINASKATPATVQGQIDTLRDSVSGIGNVKTDSNAGLETYVDSGRIVLGVRQYEDGRAVEQLFFSIVNDKLRVDHMRKDRTWHSIDVG